MLERVTSGVDVLTGQPHGDESSWHPLRLVEIAPSFAEAVSLLRRRRSLPELQLAGHALRIATTGLPDALEIEATWCATIQVDTTTAEVILPHALLDLIFRHADPAISAAALRPDHVALILEFALSDALKELETVLGWSLSVTSVTSGTGSLEKAPDSFVPLALQLRGIGTFWCHLRLAPPYLLALARYLDRISGAPERRMHLPLPVRLRWAMTELTLAELRGLTPGDVILADRSCRQPGAAIAVFGEHLVAPVELSYAGYRFGARPRLAAGSGWEWALDRDTPGGGHGGTTGDVPVRLFFELGQLEVDYRALPQTGAIMPLVAPLEDGLEIIIDGARIGRGQITTIGNATGIRVTRLWGSSPFK